MKNSIDDTIRGIFIDVLDLTAETYTLDLRREDVDNWDSIAQVSLVMSMEHAFQIKITPKEAASLNSPRAFLERIQGHGPTS